MERSPREEKRVMQIRVLIEDKVLGIRKIAHLYGDFANGLAINQIDDLVEHNIDSTERIIYVIGQGDTFVFPDTRLQVDSDEFFMNGRLKAEVLRTKPPSAKYRPARITDSEGVKLVTVVNKITKGSISGTFAYLDNEDARQFWTDKRQAKATNSMRNMHQNRPTGATPPRPEQPRARALAPPPAVVGSSRQRAVSPASSVRITTIPKLELANLTLRPEPSPSAPTPDVSSDDESQLILNLPDLVKHIAVNASNHLANLKYIKLGTEEGNIPDMAFDPENHLSVEPNTEFDLLTADPKYTRKSFRLYVNSTSSRRIRAYKSEEGTYLCIVIR